MTGRTVSVKLASCATPDEPLLGERIAWWLLDCGANSIVAHIHPQHGKSMAVARALGLAATTTTVDGEVRWEM